MRSPFRSSVRASLGLPLFALVSSLAAPAAENASASAAQLRDLTYSGDQALLAALDQELVAAGKDRTKLTALEKRLLADLTRRDSTFAARQAIAQRLGWVLATAPDAKSPAHKALVAFLTDSRDSEVARLALQPVAGPAIDQLFVDALGKSSGVIRLGLIDSLAARRAAAAVGALQPLLAGKDAATAAAATRALGEIGTSAALAALRTAPVPLAAAARLRAATRLPASEALAELRALEQEAQAPAPVRLAAFRTALDLDPANAASALVAALRSGDVSRRQVGAEAIATSDAPGLVAALTGSLASLDARTQPAVIAGLGRRRDAAAVPAVLAALQHADAEVRSAAIVALGFLPGSADVARALASAAASDNADESKLAKQSLTRLNGPGVSAAIVAAAEKSSPAQRAVFLEQIALRNQTEAIPLLLKTRQDPDVTVRTAAVAALGEIAPLSEQKALLDWAVGAIAEAEQSRALRSLVNVILRDPATATRGTILFEAFKSATPEVAARLVPALGRIGGTRSADVAADLALRNDAKLADAAVNALTRWTDDTSLPGLALVAEKAALAGVRDTARKGALRYFERNRDAWKPSTTDVVARLLRASGDAASRKSLVTLLHRADDPAALTLAESLKTDSALAAPSATAADVIRANLAGKPKLKASGAAGAVRNMLDGKTSTRWNVPAEGEEWIEIDFHRSRPLHTLTLDQTTRGAEFPERYEVYVTDDLKSPGKVVASGKGQQNKTVIALPAGTRGRYAIVRNVAERKDSQWSVVELYVD
jgi:HEAT repeat protein